MRNSLLLAPMPTASTSQILGNNETFEAYTANVYTRRVLAGEFVCINKNLVEYLINKVRLNIYRIFGLRKSGTNWSPATDQCRISPKFHRREGTSSKLFGKSVRRRSSTWPLDVALLSTNLRVLTFILLNLRTLKCALFISMPGKKGWRQVCITSAVDLLLTP